VEKALAIAMKFHHQAVTDKTIPDDIDYAQKRRNHFQKERRKLQEFRLKNLEYVMKHEERELRKHVECMNQVTAYEERQQLQLQFQQQQQRQRRLQMEHTEQQREQRGMMNEGGRGIGTKEQRRAERARKRQRSNPSKKADGGAPSDDRTLRMSLYLTNLPTDGSTTERTLQSLFCLYGRLDRVTMYRHRSTGYLKGDGLVTFGRDAAEEHRTRNGGEGGVDLVDAVCAQMNGAELPCGTTIGVQPADMDYKKKTKTEKGETNERQSVINGKHGSVESTINGIQQDRREEKTMSTAAAAAAVIHDESKDKNAKDEDDLDDFFASLE